MGLPVQGLWVSTYYWFVLYDGIKYFVFMTESYCLFHFGFRRLSTEYSLDWCLFGLYEIEVGQDEYMIRLLSRQYISFNMWFTPFKYWYSILAHVFCPWPTSFLEKHNLVWNSWIILLELLLTVSFEAWVCRIQENHFCPFVCSLTFGLVKICHFHARQWYDAPHLLSLLPQDNILVQAFIMSKDMKIVETTAWSVTVCFWK